VSYSVILGGTNWTEVASLAGWGEFRKWTEKLDGDFGELSHFVEHGWSQEIDDLLNQMRKAVKASKPSPDVADIAKQIIRAIEDKPKGAVSIQLTDGLTEEIDPEDEDEEPDETEE
jgi:hypothetical protein